MSTILNENESTVINHFLFLSFHARICLGEDWSEKEWEIQRDSEGKRYRSRRRNYGGTEIQEDFGHVYEVAAFLKGR